MDVSKYLMGILVFIFVLIAGFALAPTVKDQVEGQDWGCAINISGTCTDLSGLGLIVMIVYYFVIILVATAIGFALVKTGK